MKCYIPLHKRTLPKKSGNKSLNIVSPLLTKKIYSGWDWHLGVLQHASLLIKSEEETERILKQIDTAQRSEYEREEAQSIKYDVLLKTKHGRQRWAKPLPGCMQIYPKDHQTWSKGQSK